MSEKEVPISEDDVAFMMEKFKLSREDAITAIKNGFRVEALRNGSALDMFVHDSGIATRVEAAKREVAGISESS